jgi:hypothetical protein
MQIGELLVGVRGVIDTPMEQRVWNGKGRIPRHQSGLSTKTCCISKEGMPVKLLTHQRHKQGSRLQTAAIGADRSQRLVGPWFC